MVKSIWGIVSERVNGRMVILISKFSRYKLKVVFEVEVFRLLTNYLLKAFHTSDCHLNAYHHVKN